MTNEFTNIDDAFRHTPVERTESIQMVHAEALAVAAEALVSTRDEADRVCQALATSMLELP